MALLCAPCLIMACMTMLKCLPSCLKKWTPTFDCKCSWCDVFISLCYKSRRDDSGFHETPHQTPESPKTPSAPKQAFKRERTRESRLRKKSLKNEFNFWDVKVKNDESPNTEPTEAQVQAQAPPIPVGLGGYGVYPNFATPTPVQPQLHYAPYSATVTYTPAQQ